MVVVAHGTGARLVGQAEPGGCYAASGPTAIQWHGTRRAAELAPANDADQLRAFARSLPPGSLLRHHVAGDIGREYSAFEPVRRDRERDYAGLATDGAYMAE